MKKKDHIQALLDTGATIQDIVEQTGATRAYIYRMMNEEQKRPYTRGNIIGHAPAGSEDTARKLNDIGFQFYRQCYIRHMKSGKVYRIKQALQTLGGYTEFMVDPGGWIQAYAVALRAFELRE